MPLISTTLPKNLPNLGLESWRLTSGGAAFWMSRDSFSYSLLPSDTTKPSHVQGKVRGPCELSPDSYEVLWPWMEGPPPPPDSKSCMLTTLGKPLLGGLSFIPLTSPLGPRIGVEGLLPLCPISCSRPWGRPCHRSIGKAQRSCLLWWSNSSKGRPFNYPCGVGSRVAESSLSS